jgi:hypothetical protein
MEVAFVQRLEALAVTGLDPLHQAPRFNVLALEHEWLEVGDERKATEEGLCPVRKGRGLRFVRRGSSLGQPPFGQLAGAPTFPSSRGAQGSPATIGSAAAVVAASPLDDDLDVGPVTEVLSQRLVQLVRQIAWDDAEDNTTPLRGIV